MRPGQDRHLGTAVGRNKISCPLVVHGLFCRQLCVNYRQAMKVAKLREEGRKTDIPPSTHRSMQRFVLVGTLALA